MAQLQRIAERMCDVCGEELAVWGVSLLDRVVREDQLSAVGPACIQSISDMNSDNAEFYRICFAKEEPGATEG